MRHTLTALAGAAAVLACAGPAHAAATSTGTLALAEGAAPASMAVGYAWDASPLLTGPAAAVAVGLPAAAVRASGSRYVAVTLSTLTRPPGLLASPGCSTAYRVPGSQTAEIVDRRALLSVDGIALNVLRGRGRADVRLAQVGADALTFGEYVATGVLRVTTDGCADGETGEPVPGEDGGPFHEVRELAMFRISGEDRVLSRFAPETLDSVQVRLRRSGGVWRGALALDDPGTTSYPTYPATSAQLQIAFSGTPTDLHASCKVPPAMSAPGTSVRSRRAARALLRRAGFSRPVYAGVRRGLLRGMRGDHVVVDYSTTQLPCDLPLKFRLGRR
jgi:hypothetical protein